VAARAAEVVDGRVVVPGDGGRAGRVGRVEAAVAVRRPILV
jgi:hypothetical protein